MLKALSHTRRILAILAVLAFGFSAVTGPVHAMEEELHHAFEHHESGAMQFDAGGEDEKSIHPEHAAHCHGGYCQLQMLSRADLPVLTPIEAVQSFVALDFSLKQSIPDGLFRPPRI